MAASPVPAVVSRLPDFGAENGVTAAGRSAEKLSLPALQSRMKCDPEGYESELLLLIQHFEACLVVFQQHSALKSASLGGGDPAAAKELGDLTMFLAHVAPSYKPHLSHFPRKLLHLLTSCAHSLPPGLRKQITQALILLCNRQMIELSETLMLFMVLQTLGDKELKKLAFSHVVQSIRRMNVKHKNDVKNRVLQTILFGLLQDEHEQNAKCALSVVCDLHRRKVWYDERTGNAICMACFHKSSKIMKATLAFLLGFDKHVADDDEDDSSSDEDATDLNTQVNLSKEAIYKAHHKGTTASKKKKKAKLERVFRSMKKKQRVDSQQQGWNNYSPLQHLKDPQGFAEKLFSRLQTCNERFEVKMMIIKVIARAIGLHRLLLLNFYPFLQKYVQPHQRDVTHLLAAAVQACHDMVPPDAVESLLKQLVNQFVHDRARSEVIVVGLNAVREICLRMPLLMTEDLLQDLTLYKKSHEKGVSSAARSLIGIFREICPSLLSKKDRGRGANQNARPKAYGEKEVASSVPGAELLLKENDLSSDAESDDNEEDEQSGASSGMDDDSVNNDCDGQTVDNSDDGDSNSENDSTMDDNSDNDSVMDDDVDMDEHLSDADEECHLDAEMDKEEPESQNLEKCVNRKRKLDENAGNSLSSQSLRTLKKLASSKNRSSNVGASAVQHDGILSNEDFQRIKEMQAKESAKQALVDHGMLKSSKSSQASVKIPSCEQLSGRHVDPSKLEAHIHTRKTKEEKLAIVKAGREERSKYMSRTAVKQKKTGGLSNRQKERKKGMPLAAKRAKIARVQKERRKGKASKRFLGRKAWK